jgi:hypothetical protein
MKLSITITTPTVRPELLRQAVRGALEESGAFVEAQVRQRTPQGVGGSASGLRASIFSEVRDSPLQAVIGSNLPYALPVEFGSRPHFPPVQALIPWVQKFISLKNGETAEGVAFLIARAIARRGTPPREMFKSGFEGSQAAIVRIFETQVGRVSAELITTA